MHHAEYLQNSSILEVEDKTQTASDQAETEKLSQESAEEQLTILNDSKLNPNSPVNVVRLVFIHHSSGEDWLSPDKGGLLSELNNNNYFVTDTNHDWGPIDRDVNDGNPIGYHTDIGYWYNWFLGLNSDTYLSELYNNNYLTLDFSNSISDPGGENEIVMFKSCFSSAQVVYGSPAIDAGIPIDSISIDIEGNPRPQSNAFDIGAYER